MPVSLAVCETANVVNAALRESLGVNVGGCVAATAVNRSGSASVSDEAKTGDDAAGVTDNLQSQIVASAKRVLFAKIEYEEVKNYNESVLAKLKSKYIVIEPDNNKANGAGKIVNSNGHDNNNGTPNGNRKQTQQQSAMDVHSNQNANSNTNTNQNPNELPKPKRVLYQRENIRIGWKQSERKWQVGTGMLNVGNTCYLNSTLQALFHIPALANWLVSESSHLENCTISESCGGNGCIICAMAKTLQSTQTNQSAVRPFLIYSKLRQICKHMVVGRQEDAHEFLRFLVEAMEKAYLMRFRNYKELDQLVKETTPLNQIFGGYLRSEVRCLSCNHVSITFQHFQDLLLDIRKADTLEEAFDGYFSRERLEDMGYKCEGCKKKVSATKQFSLERAPITLCIQLKRFSMMGNKLTKQISFKPRIDLSRFAARSPTAAAQPLSYRLVSMVTHLGVSQHCGHYTAIGLTEAGSYYNFDDSYVRPIAMQSVCNTNAYIMFYELDVNSSSVSNGPKLNGLRLANGQNSPVAVAATSTAVATVTAAAVASPRFIGPQLPNGYANSNGHALGGVKTTIQYKSSPPKPQYQSQQQQPQQNGHLKFQDSAAHAKHSPHKAEAATATTANKSSCNSNNLTTNQQQQQYSQQQRILPMSSDEEDDEEEDSEEEVKANNKMPQLPSMPKMFEESESVVQTTAKLKPKTPLKSLVPYESASEEEESAASQQSQQQPQQQSAAMASNPRKRRSCADSSESDEEQATTSSTPTILSVRNGHAKTNGSNNINHNNNKAKSASNASSANVNSNNNSNKQKTDAIDEIFKSLNNYKTKHRNKADSNDDDEDDNDENEDASAAAQQTKLTSNGWQSQNGSSSKAPPSPKTPPSPAVIKSKTGIWKITHNDDADDDDDVDVDDDDDVVPKLSKNHKNPFANKAINADSGASPGPKRQKLLNGSAKSQQPQTPRIGNGYQSESMANGNAVSELLKQTHRGYGSSVLSWNGKVSEMDKELQAEARELRKRDEDDDEENEMDRGRQRKIKSASVKCNNNSTPGYNPFQEYEGQKRWHGGKSGSSFPPRFHHQNYRTNFQQRSKFKYNRFGGGSKFQQQRALKRHLASGGGFSRRQHQSGGQQQQQQQS
ncbi:hypothetical protein KR093_000742 [Drosophila rubida]|uniref:Ubiquitin carboxyl-terminal hydrolase 36 n=1 Tax=Drosophila rubida TaxID=30044 RepID=A0AAD4JZD2_9MUSC|nr:hypothetical protein KR093_000742 [Drosophila rubida]